MSFLRDHTAARQVYLIVGADNTASLRVAQAFGAHPVAFVDHKIDRTLVRYVASLR